MKKHILFFIFIIFSTLSFAEEEINDSPIGMAPAHTSGPTEAVNSLTTLETNQQPSEENQQHLQKNINNTLENAVTTSQAWEFDNIKGLSLIIICFTFFSLMLASVVLAKQKASPIYTFRIFIILTILGLAVFLVVVGYSLEQINGVITLFSAIIGYLLGKDSSDKKNDGSVQI